jgi:hypothetical protein
MSKGLLAVIVIVVAVVSGCIIWPMAPAKPQTPSSSTTPPTVQHAPASFKGGILFEN